MPSLTAVEAIFQAALEKGSPEERAAYLDQACQGDSDLRQQVERLLNAQQQLGSFLEQPAAEGATSDVVSGQWIDPASLPRITEGPGSRIGPYKLLQQVGEGGMGVVYMAEQEEPVRRKVALKIIKPGMDSAQVIARFEAERQALALMDHQNIARVLDAGTTDSGRPYFVMELVKGVPITKFCDDNHLTPRERLELFVPVCQAIQHAHQKGIIHRDVKPSNVLVTLYDGKPVPKVIDFGVAKAIEQRLTERTLFTQLGQVVGTVEYMSPEQAELNALDIDTRSDIYSLGVLLYELLTGSTPLEKQKLRGAGFAEMLRMIKEEDPPRPSTRLSGSGERLPSISAQRKTEPARLAKLVRGELDWIAMKALEKDRARRYETASALARDVERHLADEPVEACPPSVGYRLRKLVRRNKGRVIVGGLFAAMLLTVLGLVLYGVWWAERQSAERRHEQALTAARNNDALKATLDQAETALKSARLAEAVTLLGQADKQLDEQTPTELRERHDRLKRDERSAWELEGIFEERWMVSPSDTRIDSERAKRRYPLLFHGYGLAVGDEPAAATVAKVRQAIIAEALSSGLTEWFFVDPKYQGLLAVVNLLDPEPGRATLRAAIVEGDKDRIIELAKKIDGSALSPAFAIGLAVHTYLYGQQHLEILQAAWSAHPDSFALALMIGAQMAGDPGPAKKEAIGWSRIAVALRPNNPLAHYYLAVALYGGGLDQKKADRAYALEELRRAIRSEPQFGKAYAKLAFILSYEGHARWKFSPEALDAARKAIDVDSRSPLGHVVLYAHLRYGKKDYIEAAQVYERLEELMGSVKHFPEVPLSEEIDSWIINALFGFVSPEDEDGYRTVCGAVLAGTRPGIDSRPSAERVAIREQALQGLSFFLSTWNRQLAADPAQNRGTAYKRMNHWLSDPDLAGVRDEQWLVKLPPEERAQWQKLWGEVRSLRDRTAPEKAAPPPAGKSTVPTKKTRSSHCRAMRGRTRKSATTRSSGVVAFRIRRNPISSRRRTKVNGRRLRATHGLRKTARA